MSILKAKRADGGEITAVQPDSDTAKAVEELKAQGCTRIHNPETGEQYRTAEEMEHILKWIISEAWTLLEPREDEHAENWRSYAEQHAPDYIRAFTN